MALKTNLVKNDNDKSKYNECSRIFRPWDSDQDSTISSSSSNSGDEQFVYKSDVKISHENKVKVRAEYKNFQLQETNHNQMDTPLDMSVLTSTPIMPISQFDHLAFDQTSQIDYSMMQQNLYYNQPAFTDYMQFPYIGVDPFTIEQEYYRILSEEAHTKMTTAKKERPKKFKCPHCNVAFSNNGQLKGHIRIHTGNYYFL